MHRPSGMFSSSESASGLEHQCRVMLVISLSPPQFESHTIAFIWTVFENMHQAFILSVGAKIVLEYLYR